ncbi:MAG: DUF3291 domain-containing protein [Acidimicrobiales bacterium]
MNVARLRAPLEFPMMAGLVRALADVNWLADQSPGFVWRHRADDLRVTYGQIDGQQVIVTISVWTHYEALHQYVYRSAHGLFMRQRARWFEPISGFTTALWWVTEGDEPSVDVALSHLEHLRAHGPTPQAFSLRRQFDPDGVPVVRS